MAKIISASLSLDALSELKELETSLALGGRSETIRAAIHSLAHETAQHARLKGTVHALLIVTHAHAKGIATAVHKHEAVITTHLHQHVRERCVEIFVLEGNADKVTALVSALTQNKQVKQVKLVVV